MIYHFFANCLALALFVQRCHVQVEDNGFIVRGAGLAYSLRRKIKSARELLNLSTHGYYLFHGEEIQQ